MCKARFPQAAQTSIPDNFLHFEVDCLIVGGGPAGLTGATYLGRFRREVTIIDNGTSSASWIPVTNNIIGYSNDVTGPDLLIKMRKQADQYGPQRISGEIERLEVQPDGSFIALLSTSAGCS